jgi:hypothetical protein
MQRLPSRRAHSARSMLACLGMWVQSAGIHMPDSVFSESKPIDAFFKVLAERPAAAIQVLLAITWLELNTSVSLEDTGDALAHGGGGGPACTGVLPCTLGLKRDDLDAVCFIACDMCTHPVGAC